MRAIIGSLCLLVAGLAACGDNMKPSEEATPTPASEIVSGGARLRGGGVRMDVQVGRTFTQNPVRGNGKVAKPAAVVTP